MYAKKFCRWINVQAKNEYEIADIIYRKKVFNEIDYSFQSSKNNIWFHAASLVEYELAVPLILELKKKKNCKIILTFFSESGFKLKNRINEVDQYLYMPIDTKSNAKKFIEKR